tara:strand:+ start:282953 stop:284089 length:1137 start_codon:yes stop_codon:yes gene_type:complete
MHFPVEGKPRFGQNAIKSYIESQGQGRLIRSIKKFLPSKSFKATQVQGQLYTLEELIGRFLRELKTRADHLTGEDVKHVMLGRPARFALEDEKDELAQDRLKNAAEMAGFKIIEFCPEPLAAALDYQQQIDKPKRVLVVDLGGGTSDFTVIELKPGAHDVINTLGLGGISIAGDRIDGSLMASKISPHFGTEVKYQLPLGNNILTMPPDLRHRLMSPADITLLSRSDIMGFIKSIRSCTLSPDDDDLLENLFTLVEDNLGFALYEEVEASKRTVCEKKPAQFRFDQAGIEIEESITYGDFTRSNEGNFSKIFDSMNSVLKQSGLEETQIDTIFTTGGTSRIPEIQERLTQSFGTEKVHHQEAFHSVIQGLSVKARSLL